MTLYDNITQDACYTTYIISIDSELNCVGGVILKVPIIFDFCFRRTVHFLHAPQCVLLEFVDTYFQ